MHFHQLGGGKYTVYLSMRVQCEEKEKKKKILALDDDREVPITGLFIYSRVSPPGAAVCLTALGKVLLEIIYSQSVLNFSMFEPRLELLCNIIRLNS